MSPEEMIVTLIASVAVGTFILYWTVRSAVQAAIRATDAERAGKQS